MTEERFEQIIENAADALDRSMNRAWSHQPVRIVGKTISFLSGAGLIVSAKRLAENGYPKAAKVCIVSGCIVIAVQVVELTLFKKR